MKGRFLSEERIEEYRQHLISEEKSDNTIEKYLRDVKAFAVFLEDREISKELAITYKQKQIDDGYAVRSINSMLASVNSMFSFFGWYDCKVKAIKQQRQIFCSEDKELTKAEYVRLLNAAKQKKNDRLNLIIQTICGTGIRVSELQFITVEAAKAGQATVNCKGKIRSVFIVKELKKKLLRYAKEKRITTGSIFITRGGTDAALYYYAPASCKAVVIAEKDGYCSVFAVSDWGRNQTFRDACAFYGASPSADGIENGCF